MADTTINAQRRGVFYAKTDLAIDLAEVRAFKDKCARLDAASVSAPLGEPVLSLAHVPNAGTFHALFQVQTETRCGYLKLGLPSSSFAFSVEIWAMAQLANLGLPWLNAFAFSDLDRAFLFMDEAPGQPLNRFENPESQAIPEPLLFTFGATLARIHHIKGAGAGLLEIADSIQARGLHDRWAEYISLRLDEHLRECMKIRAITGMELSEIEAHFSEAGDLLDSAPIRLLHGDPGHHNVFSDGQKITAVIDWEDALCGDPIFDVAYWGTFVRDEMRARFLEGYATVSPLPSDFERRYWLYYLRVAISKTVHRHRFGAKDRPGRPPASQRIQKALSRLGDL
jgi:fructosamine-3-kinase